MVPHGKPGGDYRAGYGCPLKNRAQFPLESSSGSLPYPRDIPRMRRCQRIDPPVQLDLVEIPHWEFEAAQPVAYYPAAGTRKLPARKRTQLHIAKLSLVCAASLALNPFLLLWLVRRFVAGPVTLTWSWDAILSPLLTFRGI